MSWAEEQDWFGTEDMILDAIREEEVEYIGIPAWRMKDGELIALQDMDTSHIKNCIKMIHRNNGWRSQYLPYFGRELHRRGQLPNTPKVIYINCEEV